MASSKTRIGSLICKYFKGYPLPLHASFTTEKAQQAVDYESRDGDTILFAYPKTGSTWILYVVWNILNHCEGSLGDLSDILIVEMHGKEVIDAIPEPRFYKTHLYADMIKINPKSKYIYVHRNPADVFMSCYHFFDKLEKVDYDLDSFFEAFMVGDLPYGDVFDHVLAANAHKDDENFLMVSYEETKKDPLATVMKLAAFLGEKYHKPLVKNPSLAKKIVEVTSFDHMKKNVSFCDPQVIQGDPHMDFYYRKGQVGEGRSGLTAEQKKRLEDRIRLKMAGTDFVDLWLNQN